MKKRSTIYAKVGQHIVFLRKERKLSQERLAWKASMDRSYMGLIERGERAASLEMLEKVARALDVPFHSLFLFPAEPKNV